MADLLQDMFQEMLNFSHSSASLSLFLASRQASIAAGRQSSSQNGTSSQQTGSTQATVSAFLSVWSVSQEPVEFKLSLSIRLSWN